MSNPFTLSVRLRQHSPLIHFQPDQSGATLRATELKPKLDKFLIDEVFNKNFQLYKKYLIEHNEKKYDKLNDNEKKKYELDIHKAFDYKAKITNKSGKDTQDISIITIEKTGISYNHQNLEFFSFHTELLKIIKEIINDFFILHNFGLRQSKGFGCFTTGDTNQALFEETILEKYPVFYKKNAKNQDINSEIDWDYKILKSGINHKKYIKSNLFRYMSEKKQIDWEKRKIKEALKSEHKDVYSSLRYNREAGYNRTAKCTPDNKEPNYRYIRALLGLAEHNEFRTWKGKIQINIKDSKDEIERFQSPLMFKVFNKTIYILPNEIPDSMYQRDFDFLLDNKVLLFTIPTPHKNQFSMIEFLDYSLINSSNIIGWEKIQRK